MIYKNEVLNERELTHGSFSACAALSQRLKALTHVSNRCLDSIQRESLDQICTKIARICSGNPNELDHWKDIAGYANLVSEELEKQQTENQKKIKGE